MKKKKNKTVKIKQESLIEDETFILQKLHGNDILRRQIWADHKGTVTRYSLAYINHHVFMGNNGRVLGYDNVHGFHHRHYLGEIEAVDFLNFGDLEQQFQQEFEAIHEKTKKKFKKK